MSRDDIVEQAARVLSRAWGHWYPSGSLERQRMLADALADAGLLAQRLPDREEIAEELSGWPIGDGDVWVSIYEAREIVDAVLALLNGKNR